MLFFFNRNNYVNSHVQPTHNNNNIIILSMIYWKNNNNKWNDGMKHAFVIMHSEELSQYLEKAINYIWICVLRNVLWNDYLMHHSFTNYFSYLLISELMHFCTILAILDRKINEKLNKKIYLLLFPIFVWCKIL